MKKILAAGFCLLYLLAFPAQAEAGEGELSIPAMSYGGGTFVSHIVQLGDNLYRIGHRYGFDAQTLACINDLADPRYLSVGQELLIPTENESTYQISGTETLDEVAKWYGVEPIEIALANDIWDIETLPVGLSLSIPSYKAWQMATPVIASRSVDRLFLRPVEGVISSSYGYRHGEFHTGLDIAVEQGTTVRAALAGSVVSADWDGNYGYAVVIDHHNGYKTRYAHNSMLLVHAGEIVDSGQAIALSGSTGRSTGPHVHWEIIKDGVTTDPLVYYR